MQSKGVGQHVDGLTGLTDPNIEGGMPQRRWVPQSNKVWAAQHRLSRPNIRARHVKPLHSTQTIYSWLQICQDDGTAKLKGADEGDYLVQQSPNGLTMRYSARRKRDQLLNSICQVSHSTSLLQMHSRLKNKNHNILPKSSFAINTLLSKAWVSTRVLKNFERKILWPNRSGQIYGII